MKKGIVTGAWEIEKGIQPPLGQMPSVFSFYIIV
jgi:hypothetical protein